MVARFGQSTAWLEWGGDLVLNQYGSVQMATGWDEVRQRITRRLLTIPRLKLQSGLEVPPEYIFHPNYGIGLGRRIGEPASQQFKQRVERAVREAVLIDQGVDVTRPPGISINIRPDHIVELDIVVYLKDKTAGTISLAIE